LAWWALETTTGKVEENMVGFVVLFHHEAWRSVVVEPDAQNSTFGNGTRSLRREQLDRTGFLGFPKSDMTRSQRPLTWLQQSVKERSCETWSDLRSIGPSHVSAW